MSIKQGLLALLAEGSMYGYQLRNDFEHRTGGTWPLNVGQVYTTLGRLERDGLVEPAGHDAENHIFYRITDEGRAKAREWFETPVERTSRPRDELAIKLAMAITVPGVDVRQVVQGQRTHTMRAMQDCTRLKNQANDNDDVAWLLVLDSLIFHAEAEVRWLDHCETRVARAQAKSPAQDGTHAPGEEPAGAESTEIGI